MTVQTNNNSIAYVGNGSTVHFDYDFLILDDDHLKVYFGDVLQTSGYVVSGVLSQTGGTVAFAVAPPNGTAITLTRSVPFLQLTDYQPYDAFPAESHERALDLLTMMSQQLKDASDRSMQYPVGGNRWDAKGNEIINVAEGGADTSAANVGQVKDLIAQLAGPDSAAQLRSDLAALSPVPGAALSGYGTGTVEDALDDIIYKTSLINKAIRSSTVVRPVFVRQTCTTTNGSALVSVQNASQFAVGDNLLLCAGGAQQYSNSFDVKGSPARNGTIYLVLDGYLTSNIAVLTSDTAAAVAAKLRAVVVPGWTASGSGTVTTFTKTVPGVTVGAFISDIGLVGLPYTEGTVTDPTFNQISKIINVNTTSNTVTLDSNAQYTGTGLCYLEHGKALSSATQNGTVSIVMDGGEYLFHDGLKFKSDFTGIMGGQNGDITIYAIGGKDIPVIECEKPSAGEAYYGSVINNIFIDMQNSRRPGIVGRRLWDASSWDNVLVDRIHPSFVGVSVRRHSSQPAPTTANDQTVVSQSVCMRGVHGISRSPMAGLPVYMEYVQEANLDNVKGVFAADFNSVALAGTSSAGVQLEACRGVLGNNMSAAGAKDGLVITSVTGESRGITIVGATLETNENNVDVRGGAYDVFDVNIVNPRTIGGGTGKFKIQRLTRGRIECGDRPIDIAAACKGVHGVVDGAAAAANAGPGCYITRTSVTGTNVTAQSYPSGLSLGCGGNRVDILTSSIDAVASGSKVVGVDYPFTSNDTALVLMTNKAGTQVLSRVLVGPADSAQAGFRVLRILN